MSKLLRSRYQNLLLVLPALVERLSESYAQRRITLLFGYHSTATESTRKLQQLLSQKGNHRSRKQQLIPVPVSLLARMNVIDISLYRQTLAKYESDKLVFEKDIAHYYSSKCLLLLLLSV
jgi:hypothetical protein